MKGFLLVDKEKGMTSFDVVRDVRRKFGVKKVGHSGTLDPLATGLLLIAMGEATKLLEYFVGCDKEYEVVGKFGFVSDTFDADGEIVKGLKEKECDRVEVEAELGAFVGDIEQVPPKYSALKINGKKAYELARAGQDVEMKVRNVRVGKFEILDFNWPEVKFAVQCSSGTYVRSLVHDLGARLGCGAYVQELRRISVGEFNVKDADEEIISIEKMVSGFACLELSDEDFEGLKDGRVLDGRSIEGEFAVAFYNKKVVGIVENYKGGIKYRKVIL